MPNFAEARERMVITQMQARGIKNNNVLDAFRKVPRERFVPVEYHDQAYDDRPLAIASGQTISQPYMAALMTECLNLKKTDSVLEIGTGSGYQAAILAELCAAVFTVERIPTIADAAMRILNELEYKGIRMKVDDGSCGWKEYAPYNGIIVTCGAPAVPTPLKEQLADYASCVIPVGGNYSQILMVIERQGAHLKETEVCGCAFVPLVGKYGWKKS